MKKIYNLVMSSQRRLGMFFTACLLMLMQLSVTGNNVRITNLVNTNPGSANPILTFDIAWDNSWRVSTGASNYDAVWIFVKFQRVPTGSPHCESYLEWDHALMTNNPADFTTGAPLTYHFVSDLMGIFVHRSADGSGNIAPTPVTIRLNLPVPSFPFAPEYNFRVFAIEMVHIPSGNFELGDGVSTNTFNSITITGATGILTSAVIGGGMAMSIPAAFPNGFNAFYSMKYEVTQQQYVDFLNTLTFTQQLSRTILTAAQLATAPGTGGLCAMVVGCVNRNGIKLIQQGINPGRAGVFANDLQTAPGDAFNSSNDGQTIAMNHINISDLYSYLDWAGLRPMTNLEFEKISRGSGVLFRLANEYIWATLNITQAQSTQLINANTPSEVSIFTGNGLVAFGSAVANGPLRVGFSATATTNRETSGSSFYGVMNLGGNVWEIVSGGSGGAGVGYFLTSSNFGDGRLTAAGVFNVTNWSPLVSSGNFWHAEFRGGSYASAASTVRTSDRSLNFNFFGFGNTSTESRWAELGGRGVR